MTKKLKKLTTKKQRLLPCERKTYSWIFEIFSLIIFFQISSSDVFLVFSFDFPRKDLAEQQGIARAAF